MGCRFFKFSFIKAFQDFPFFRRPEIFWSQVIDLDVPSEEVEFERALAKRSGIDGLIFDLLYHKRSLGDAAEHLSDAMLSDLERKVLGEMSEQELVEVSWF